LGRAIALGLAAAGADLAINYKTNASAAEDEAAAIAATGRRAIAV
jgi:NAD(P)-dependent dehydrogenase (short-subunit alcohol dehydrogenase family)